MGRVFSGVQPTGNLHLGNYLGAIKNFVSLQNNHECIYCVVDMHAITVKQDPKVLKNNILEVAASFIAAGINPEKSIIFAQSQVSAHAELAWIFNCVARLGWLNRMTQFKEKAGKNRENASAGLYTYPVLMAADILAYHATHVPVGDDQRQHLELARDIAQKFNNDFNLDYFPITEPVIMGAATRVMSLRDGKNKMSKSDVSDYSRLNLTDSIDDISNKIRKAKTDPLPLPDLDALDDKENFKEEIINSRAEAVNLLNIYSALSNETTKKVVEKFVGKQFSDFKKELNEVAVETLAPITKEMRKLLEDKTYLTGIIKDGGNRANIIAQPIITKVKDIVGLY
jgi:tryptophanyl-tRNA synthetase|tara:strand:- start:699 stop:1721 length:1023 start_codon:yes stop_codon:yes gene_type:complete